MALEGKSRLILIAVLSSFGGSFHFGYHSTCLNASEAAFHKFLNASYLSHYGSELDDDTSNILWSVLTSLSLFGQLVGLVFIVPVAENLGRRKGLFLATCVLCVSIAMEAASKGVNSFELFGVGRFLRGLSQGWGMVMQTMFLSEISPMEWRGNVGGITEIMMEIGMIAGGIMGLPEVFGNVRLWPFISVVEMATIAFVWICLAVVHESPKYLTARGETEKCLDSLKFYQHTNTEKSFQDISDEIACQETRPTVLVLFRTPYLRRGMLIGALVLLMSAFSGIDTIDYYSTVQFMDIGLKKQVARYASVALSCQALLAAVVASFIIDRVGRRPLMLVTGFGLTVTKIIFMVFTILYAKYEVAWMGYVGVVSQFLQFFFYGIGPAVLQWIVLAEVIPQNARSTAIALVDGLYILIAAVIQLGFLPLSGVIGGYCLMLFAVPLALLSIMAILVFPETKNRSTAEIVHYMENKSGLLGRGKKLKFALNANEHKSKAVLCTDREEEDE